MASVGQRLAGFSAAFVASLAAVGACTVFNGLTVTALPDASDAPPGDAPPPASDAALDAGTDALPPSLTYLTTSQGAQLCTLAATCPLLSSSIQSSVGVPIDANNFSLCMEWAAGPIPGTRQGFSIQQPVLQCMAQASSCAAAGACDVFENIGQSDPRCGSPVEAGSAFCSDDDTAKIDCDGLFVQHCGLGMFTPGASCHVGNDGYPWCSLGGLDAGCPANASCIGTFQDYCGMDGLHFRLNCANVGDSCGYVDGGVQCGEACSTIALVCDGNVAKSCDGAQQSPFDCATLGGTCSSKENAIYCARPTDTCTPLDADINVCTGTSLSLCVGGQKSSFDCASISKQCLPGVVPQTPHCG